MIMLAAPQQQPSVAIPSLAILLLGGATIFVFGAGWAVMKRANSDYKKTKASLPGMRKDFWRAWWAMIKVGFWVGVVFVVLVVWAVQDVKDAPAAPAVPASVHPR